MVGGLGWTEILVIGAVVLLFLGGGKKLPEFARSLGEALNEFKDARSGDDSDNADNSKTEDEEKEETTQQ